MIHYAQWRNGECDECGAVGKVVQTDFGDRFCLTHWLKLLDDLEPEE